MFCRPDDDGGCVVSKQCNGTAGPSVPSVAAGGRGYIYAICASVCVWVSSCGVGSGPGIECWYRFTGGDQLSGWML